MRVFTSATVFPNYVYQAGHDGSGWTSWKVPVGQATTPRRRADPAHLPVPRRRRQRGDAPDGVEGDPPADVAARAAAAASRSVCRVGLVSRLEPPPPACDNLRP